jgi:hypothetical protein
VRLEDNESEELKNQFPQLEGNLDLQNILKPVPIRKKEHQRKR